MEYSINSKLGIVELDGEFGSVGASTVLVCFLLKGYSALSLDNIISFSLRKVLVCLFWGHNQWYLGFIPGFVVRDHTI